MKYTILLLNLVTLILFSGCAGMKEPPEFVIVDRVVVKKTQLVHLNNDSTEILSTATPNESRFFNKVKLKKYVRKEVCQTDSNVKAPPKSVIVGGVEYIAKEATDLSPEVLAAPKKPIAVLVDFDLYDTEELNHVTGYRITCQ